MFTIVIIIVIAIDLYPKNNKGIMSNGFSIVFNIDITFWNVNFSYALIIEE